MIKTLLSGLLKLACLRIRAPDERPGEPLDVHPPPGHLPHLGRWLLGVKWAKKNNLEMDTREGSAGI